MFFSIILARFFGYIFQVIVGRALGPEEFSIFGTLFSIFLIFTVPATTISLVISRYTSEFKVNNDFNNIKNLMNFAFKKTIKIALIVFIIILLLSLPLSNFLRISNLYTILIFNFSIFWSFLIPVILGILQGLQNFKWLSFLTYFQTLSRLIIVSFFLYLGLVLNGTVLSFTIGPLFPFLLGIFALKGLFRLDDDHQDTLELYHYTLPILLVTGIMVIMQNIDIIVVKHFFSERESGLYIAASEIAKTIIYIGSAVSISVFPKVSELSSKSKSSFKFLKTSFILISSISLIFILLCIFFNREITLLLFGKKYLDSANILPFFSISMSLFGVSFVIFNYLNAIKKFKFIFPLAMVLIFQIFLIFIFHSRIIEILYILIICSFMTFLISILNYQYISCSIFHS
ncbi:MAG: oligosaccharide flippase family protein [Candidatus Methanofastidiosa archaeon]|nr:oligosaccharide flippase family protein [Candidatus Methanofastidiosa archaeon]